MRALKSTGRALHQIHVQMLGIKAHAFFQEGIANVPVEYFIYIFFFYTGTDGVKILRFLAGIEYGDILRQAGVERQRQSFHGYARLTVKIRAVPEGVDTRIRAPAADHTKPLAANLEDGVLQRFGHGYVILLYLPAMIAAAVIAQTEGNIFHSAYLLSTNMAARNTIPSARAI